MIKKLLTVLIFFALCAVPSQATIVTLSSGDLPYTPNANDTIRFTGNLTYSGYRAFIINKLNVRIEGQGDTLFYGTAGGSGVDGLGAINITGSAGSGFYMRDFTLMHDPGNNGAYADPHSDPDTASLVRWNHNMYFNGSPNGITLINCNFVVYGQNTRNVDCQGNGTTTVNVFIDSCHFWNETHTYGSRHSYDGSAVRLETRTGGGGNYSAHIYRSVVHRAPQMGFSIYGQVANPSTGIEVAYCTTYVDARNDPSALYPDGQNANQYGISTRMTAAPFRIHHNYISAGTQYGGSRGIMLESGAGTVSDSITVDSNVLNIWSGPDAENGAGECRGIRVREIDGGVWDYYKIVGNQVEITTDYDGATAHIGTAGWCLNMTFGFGGGYGLAEGNTLILRCMDDDASVLGAAMHAGNEIEWGTKTTPFVFRYNRIISSAWINWGADKANGGSAHKHRYFSDSMSFLPASDSGVNVSHKVTWRMSQGALDEPGLGNYAVNIWYDTTTGARDTNIVHSGAQLGELNLQQEIPISARAANGDLIPGAGFKITDSNGTVLMNGTSSTGDTTGIFRYWKTYGYSAGADSNFNPFDIIVWYGTDTTYLTDTVIDWKVTSLDVTVATIHIWTQDTINTKGCPVTISSSYSGDLIRFGENLSCDTSAFRITGANVTIDGNGKTLLYCAGITDSVNLNDFGAFYVNADGFSIYDLKIVHDPENDGDDLDTASIIKVEEAHGIWIDGQNGFTMKRCTVITFGREVRCVDSYGSGASTKNVLIDSCHFWNYSTWYKGRQTYAGAAIRLEMRPTFSGEDFAAHIYRSVIHIAAHNSISIQGNAGVGGYSKGNEVAFCTTYTDQVNTNPAGGQTGSSANAYGMLFTGCIAPFSVHDNVVRAGTTRGGSRGIMFEDVVGTPTDSVQIYNNNVITWVGPDEENASGVNRVMRLRAITNEWDYVHVYNNHFECVTDTAEATTWIGDQGYVINVSIDDGDIGAAHGLIEGNTMVYRSLDSVGTNGAAALYGIQSVFTGVAPITIRNNKYTSSDFIAWLADNSNAYATHDLTMTRDTFGFLPAGDSGANLSDQVTYFVGYSSTAGSKNFSVNAYYQDGATDTNIVLASGGSHDLSLQQTIPITVFGELASPDSLMGTFRVICSTLVTPGATNIEVYDTTIASGTTLDFRYWKTYGSGAGSDSSWTDWTFVVMEAGVDTVKITDTTIDWTVTCLNFRLDGSRGTLDPADSCSAGGGGGEPPGPPTIQIRRRRSPSYQLGSILDNNDIINEVAYEKGHEIFRAAVFNTNPGGPEPVRAGR